MFKPDFLLYQYAINYTDDLWLEKDSQVTVNGSIDGVGIYLFV